MTDWLDDLLSGLPSDPQPTGLDLRLRAHLRETRRQERWTRGALGASLVSAAALGLWLAIPFLGNLGVVLPHLRGEALRAWAHLFAAAPLSALNTASQSLLSWGFRVGESLQPGLILALVLIAVPALNALAGLVRDIERQEEGFA